MHEIRNAFLADKSLMQHVPLIKTSKTKSGNTTLMPKSDFWRTKEMATMTQLSIGPKKMKDIKARQKVALLKKNVHEMLNHDAKERAEEPRECSKL